MIAHRTKVFALAAALLAAPVLADDAKPTTSDSPSEAMFRQSGALLDRSPQRRPMMLSFFLGVPYNYSFYGFPFGLGARFMIPIVHDGFIAPVNDSFGIEFGADLFGVAGTRFYPSLGIPVEVYWQFHFTKNFSAYAKVGAMLEVNFVGYACTTVACRAYTPVWFQPIGNVGIIYKFSQKVSFRAEAGYPWIKVGLGIDL
jgi:hypothetical protein